jgi:O-methyltransferase
MMLVVAVADHHFLRGAARLVASLSKTHPEANVTLYCDHPDAFQSLLAAGNVELKQLPAITERGAKRAKFTAYADAIQRGSFLYLDCDVVVLDRLDELLNGHEIAAADDDLTECPFIADRRYPWPGDPSLPNNLYINSGVVFFPAESRAFLEKLEHLARDEATWTRYILPGQLYDNHFLCAQLNLECVPVRRVSGSRFNWQGFRNQQRIQVEREGRRLITHCSPVGTLALVHFAGIADPDRFLRTVNPSIASRIYAAGLDARFSVETEEAELLAACDDAFARLPRDRGADLLAASLNEAVRRLHLKETRPTDAPRCRIEVQALKTSPTAEAFFTVSVTVFNHSPETWVAQGDDRIQVSYHWLNALREVAVYDGLRTPLPRDLLAGESETLLLRVKAPAVAGMHHLQVDLLREGSHWFGDIFPGGLGEIVISVLPPPPPAAAVPRRVDLAGCTLHGVWQAIDVAHQESAPRNDLIAWEEAHLFFSDLSPADIEIIRAVRSATMTTPARLAALLAAVDHVVFNSIPGAFVECGVWKGGSSMAMALRLRQLGVTNRDLVLCDTFEGMPEPTEVDRSIWGESAPEKFAALRSGQGSEWARASLDHVRENLERTGYPSERLRYVVGRVEKTLPENAPAQIALLRLDTDWYASTLHELKHLVPRMPKGAIVIVDDYGHWQGSRQAVEEFFAMRGRRPFLHRLDDAARLWVIN